MTLKHNKKANIGWIFTIGFKTPQLRGRFKAIRRQVWTRMTAEQQGAELSLLTTRGRTDLWILFLIGKVICPFPFLFSTLRIQAIFVLLYFQRFACEWIALQSLGNNSPGWAQIISWVKKLLAHGELQVNQVNVIRSTAGHGLVGGPEATNEAHKGRERWVSWVTGEKACSWVIEKEEMMLIEESPA